MAFVYMFDQVDHEHHYHPRESSSSLIRLIKIILFLQILLFPYSSSSLMNNNNNNNNIVKCQVISYGMRKLAISMNQFGIDMLRSMNRMMIMMKTKESILPSVKQEFQEQKHYDKQSSFVFCPFCVGSSLAMLLAGLESNSSFTLSSSSSGNFNNNFTSYSSSIFLPHNFVPSSQTSPNSSSNSATAAYEALRHTLYLSQMQPQEIHLAFYDLAQHLQSNIPEGFRTKRSTFGSIKSIQLKNILNKRKKRDIDQADVQLFDDDDDDNDDDIYDDEIAEINDDIDNNKNNINHLLVNDDGDDEEDNELDGEKQLENIEANIDDSFNNDEDNDDDSYIGAESRGKSAKILSNGIVQQEPTRNNLQHKRSNTNSNTNNSSPLMMIHFINQLYIQRYLPVDYNYYGLMQHYYKTPIRTMDFAYAGEESRQHINAVVEQQSHGKVCNIVPKEVEEREKSSLSLRFASTRLLLLSALYFQGLLVC